MDSINAITPRTETVIVLQGDDDERLRELKAEVERLEKAKPNALGARLLSEPDPEREWAEAKANAERAHNEFATEAEERGVKVVLRALGRKTWRDLIAKHPPREGNEADKNFGANLDALQEDLVPMCMASPAGTLEECSAFLDSLNAGQFGDLAIKAWRLNTGITADPKALLSSGRAPSSTATSN